LHDASIKRHLLPLLLMCGVFIIGIAVLIANWIDTKDTYPLANKGELDATSWDFSQLSVIPLAGEWEFYPGELLTPESFAQSKQREAQFIHVPGDFSKLTSEGSEAFGTYRLKLLVNEEASYSLRLKKVRLSSQVFINGENKDGRGIPAADPSSFEASNQPYISTIDAEAGAIELIIQVASFENLDGGIVQSPEFGLTKDVYARQDTSRLLDMCLITALFMFGLYYVGMFRHWRREPHLKYFSYFCFSLGLFFCFDNEILFLSLFPTISFYWLQKMLFFLPTLTIFFYGQYVLSYLLKSNLKFSRIMSWIITLYLMIELVLPNHFLVDYLKVHVLLASVYLCTLLVVIFRNRERGVQGKGYLLLGFFALIAMWVYAQFRYQLALDPPYYMSFSPLMLVLSQALLMADRIHESYIQNEKLNQQLLAFDRQKDEFLAKTSHELRTPLHGIINLTQIMIDDQQQLLPPKHVENVRFVHAIGNRLAGLVHDVLDLNKIRYGQLKLNLKPVDLAMTVEFVVQTLSVVIDKPSVRIVNDTKADIPYVWADEDRLQQILYNLIENGLKYTEHGAVRIHADVIGEEIEVVISDTGIGIPQERLANLFQPFTTYDDQEGWSNGLGLGLSIVKELVEQQQGRLQVASTDGKGSTFKFTLPLAMNTNMPKREQKEVLSAISDRLVAEEAAASDRDAANIHIYIVDDEPVNRKILIHVVSSLQYRYTAVGSGEEVLELLRERPLPDLVLLDIMMPGISGLDVCKEIRKTHGMAELPVLMLTAFGQKRDLAAAFAAGTNDILQKPFEMNELKARMQSLLAMKQSFELSIRKEMDFLQAQITPHFLYNSLNAVVGLSYTDTQKLRELIVNLSTYLRSKFMFLSENGLVPFERELELIEAYLAIEEVRFSGQFSVQYEIEEGFHCMLPPLILQPIVENAVRHGLATVSAGGRIKISASTSEEGAKIVVEDNGAGMEEDRLHALQEGRTGRVGIDNVNRRLFMSYGRRLVIESELGVGTRVTLLLSEGARYESNINRR